jgi:hypothetical protein
MSDHLKQNDGRIILDNAGGVTLQLGSYAHHYQDLAMAAEDLSNWLDDGDTSGWEGHEEAAAEIHHPTQDHSRNQGYRTIVLDRDVDNEVSIAAELEEVGWVNGDLLAQELMRVA